MVQAFRELVGRLVSPARRALWEHLVLQETSGLLVQLEILVQWDLQDLQALQEPLDLTASQERPGLKVLEDLQVLLVYLEILDLWEILASRVSQEEQELWGSPGRRGQGVLQE